MPLIHKLPALHEPHARRFAFQLVLASVAAMVIANALGLVNPWWASMAVWMVSQPTRGLLVERSAAQILGTCLGAAVGAALSLIPDLGMRLICLALWMALACSTGNLMRHQRAYGAVMASLAAVVVVLMSGSMDPARFALMRVIDTVIGVASSVLFIALWSPRGPGEALLERARTAGEEALALAGMILGTAEKSGWLAREQHLLADLAGIEAASEDAASGSIAYRRRLRPLRGLLASLLDVMAVARIVRERVERNQDKPDGPQEQSLMQACGQALEAYARGLGDNGRQEQAAARLDACLAAARQRGSVLASLLEELRDSLAAAHSDYLELASSLPGEASGHALSSPNWAGAKRAALRCLVACLAPAALWLLTGNELGRYVVLGACVFISVFAAADDPVVILKQILLGGVGAVAGTVLWRAGLMHVLQSGYESLILAVPFMFVAGVIQAHRPTAFIGLALNMIFAVMAQPIHLHPAPAQIVALSGVALLCGLLFSLACFRWIVPMSSAHRRSHLSRAMRREVGAISARAGDPRAARHLARLRYLALDLLSRAGTPLDLAHGALSALVMGHTLLRVGKLVHGAQVSAAAYQAAQSAMEELRRGGLAADYLRASLSRAAMRVESDMVMMPDSILPMQELSQSLRDASACVAWQPLFLVGSAAGSQAGKK